MLALLLACQDPDPSAGRDARQPGPRPDPEPAPHATLDPEEPVAQARWQFLVYMAGDNDLEEYVTHDLNELEVVGSGEGVEVLVQADRIDGYDDADGDWEGTRRYRIEPDLDLDVVRSPVLEDLGELDMGDPATLKDFVDWAEQAYPAEHRVLVVWNHGDGWSLKAAPPPPMIGSDDSSGTWLSVAKGDLRAALEGTVARAGRFDLVAFDACNMASWEVAHELQPVAEVMSASAAWVGWEGLFYAEALAYLREEDATAHGLAAVMAEGPVARGGETTWSGIDLDRLLDVSLALDHLAEAGLQSSEERDALLAARDRAVGADRIWKDWYLDLADLGLEASTDPLLAQEGLSLYESVLDSVVANYTAWPYLEVGGLTVWFDPDPGALRLYEKGSWSEDTRWDEFLDSTLAQRSR